MKKHFSHNEILNYYITLLNSMTEAHKRVEKLIAQVQPESLVEFETMHVRSELVLKDKIKSLSTNSLHHVS